MKKVVYLSFFPLTKRTAKDWYLDYLTGHKVQAEYWHIAHPKARLMVADESYRDFVREISDYKRLGERIKAEGKDIAYVILVPVDCEATKLLQILTRNNCKIYFVQWGQMPVMRPENFRKIFKLLLHAVRDPATFIGTIYLRLLQKAGLIKPFDTVFKAGSVPAWVKCRKIVPVSLCDYETYRNSLETDERLVDGPYCVFLDTYLPFHEDLDWIGLSRIEPKAYFNALNRFFSLLEKKYKVKVVIAAHPKSKYDSATFNGRIILKDVTPGLVKDAQFVISHHSTSVSYAVLNKKPLIFVFTEEIRKVYEKTTLNYILSAALYLNASVYNIDEVFAEDQIQVRPADIERYDSYKYEFITSKEIENTPSSEIFAREVTS